MATSTTTVFTKEQVESNRRLISNELKRIKDMKIAVNNALSFVCCFYYSPVSTTVEMRLGAFEDNSELYLFKESLEKTYIKYEIPHSIYII